MFSFYNKGRFGIMFLLLYHNFAIWNTYLVNIKHLREREREREREKEGEIEREREFGTKWVISQEKCRFSDFFTSPSSYMYCVYIFSFLKYNYTASIARSCFQVIRIEIKETKFKCTVWYFSFYQTTIVYARYVMTWSIVKKIICKLVTLVLFSSRILTKD